MQPLENIIKNTFFITQFIYTFITLYIYCFLFPFMTIKKRLINFSKKYRVQVLHFEGEDVLGSHFGTSRVSQVSVLQSEGGTSVSGARGRLPLFYHVAFFSLPNGNIGKLKIVNYDCNHSHKLWKETVSHDYVRL